MSDKDGNYEFWGGGVNYKTPVESLGGDKMRLINQPPSELLGEVTVGMFDPDFIDAPMWYDGKITETSEGWIYTGSDTLWILILRDEQGEEIKIRVDERIFIPTKGSKNHQVFTNYESHDVLLAFAESKYGKTVEVYQESYAGDARRFITRGHLQAFDQRVYVTINHRDWIPDSDTA